jgi:hypothetical protein
LERVIPTVEHLQDRGTDADGQKNGNEQPSDAPMHERDDISGGDSRGRTNVPSLKQ